MLRLVFALFVSGASMACGFAAVGLALYAHSPSVNAAAALFGSYGFVVGLLCGGLHLVLDGLAVRAQSPLTSEEMAGLVRATLAHAAAERKARAGSAADRKTAAVPTVPTAAAVTPQPAAVPVHAPAPVAVARPRVPAPPQPIAVAVAVTAPRQALPIPAPGARRYADSAFGA